MTENQRRCPHCGRVQPMEDNICLYCGQPMKAEGNAYTPLDQEAKQQRADLHRASLGRHRQENGTDGPAGLLDGKARKVLKTVGKLAGIAGAALLALWLVKTALPQGVEQVRQDHAQAAARQDPEATAASIEPTCYPFPWEEEQALDADALWQNPDRWESEYPGLAPGEYKDMEIAARLVGYGTREELLQALTDMHFSEKTAQTIVERLQVDWDLQCYKAMRRYLKSTSFSPRWLEECLEYDGFTQDQIQKAFERLPMDWGLELPGYAALLLEDAPMPEAVLVDRLKDSGFAEADIAAWQQDNTIDYRYQAIRAARACQQYYLELDDDILKKELEEDGFPAEHIEYAAERLGLP